MGFFDSALIEENLGKLAFLAFTKYLIIQYLG